MKDKTMTDNLIFIVVSYIFNVALAKRESFKMGSSTSEDQVITTFFMHAYIIGH